MPNALKRLAGSSKAWTLLAVIVAGAAFVLTGHLPVADYWKFVGGLSGVLMMATAAEDAAAKRNPGNIRNDSEDTQ